MIGHFIRRLFVVLLAAAAGYAGWRYIPGSTVDRAAFTAVARGFANPPLYVAGGGSHAAPWSLRTMSTFETVDPTLAPTVISLGDDPDGVFQSSPPSPIDWAVILRNLRRLGIERVAIPALMAWESPDVVALTALETELGRFESVLTAAPLSRGAVPEAMPPAFRAASLALESVRGDAGSLPQVNRVPVPGTVLGGPDAKAGFTVLESEPTGERQPLIARWDDRVVLAFPVLAVLERENLPLQGVEVWVGQYLRLSPTGPVVPIDATGRLAVEVPPIPALGEIATESLIDGEEELIPEEARQPLVIRDDQSAADPAVRAYSSNLAGAIATIASEAGFAAPRVFPRLPPRWELGVLGGVCLLVGMAAGTAGFKRAIVFGILAAAVITAQWLGAGLAGIWLPGLPALGTVLLAVVCPPIRSSRRNLSASTANQPPAEL